MIALVEGLPPESALRRGEGDWLLSDHLLATVVEIVDAWGRNMCLSLGVKPSDLPPPFEVPRPGGEEAPTPPSGAVATMQELLEEGRG